MMNWNAAAIVAEMKTSYLSIRMRALVRVAFPCVLLVNGVRCVPVNTYLSGPGGARHSYILAGGDRLYSVGEQWWREGPGMHWNVQHHNHAMPVTVQEA